MNDHDGTQAWLDGNYVPGHRDALHRVAVPMLNEGRAGQWVPQHVFERLVDPEGDKFYSRPSARRLNPPPPFR